MSPKGNNTILYAEDDQNFAELLQITFRRADFNYTLQIVNDGSEAVDYLKGEGKYADRLRYPFPCAVLADLKMPKISGFELLDWIRRQSPFPHLPVIVLTGSDEYKELQKGYSLGANSFLTKPLQVEELKELIRMLENYWLRLNQLDQQMSA